MSDVYLSTFGMNAGLDNPHDILLRYLNQYENCFKKTFVCDGRLTDGAKEYYSRLKKTEIEDFPWNDDYKERYERNVSKVPDGGWVLHLDSDELPSSELCFFIKSDECASLQKKYNTLCLPCILCLTEDDKTYYMAEKEPDKEYHGQWTKNIFYKKDKALQFTAHGSHIVPNHGQHEKGFYVPYPYLHCKSLESFVYNDCLQGLLNPAAQRFTPTDVSLFKMFTQCYRTTKEFKESMKKGTWSPPLKKFAWDRRREFKNPISRLAWAYFILEGNPMPESDSFMEWDNVKQYVIDLSIFNQSKEISKKSIEQDKELKILSVCREF